MSLSKIVVATDKYTIDTRINSFDLYFDKKFLGVGRTLGDDRMACCKDKGVRTQCLGICDMDEDKSKSEARFVGGCHVYEEVILECVNGNQFYIYT